MTRTELEQHEEYERTVPLAVRRAVLERDNEQCQVCGKTQYLHLHHWKHFRSLGGGHTPENLVTVCWKCHVRIHNHEIDVVVVLVGVCWTTFAVGRRGYGA